MTREAVTAAQRVVVKVGSSSLTTAHGGIDPERVRSLVDSLAGVRARGADLVLVSSGAIAAGLAPLAFRRRPRDLARQQAAASVGQGLLVHRYTEEFARHGQVTGQVLLTLDDVTRRSHYRNAQRTFDKLLELGAVPIVNENDTVATNEIRFGDNDRLAALVAHLVHADLLVLLSDVDGLYDAPPGRPGSTRIARGARQQRPGRDPGRPRRQRRRHRRHADQARGGPDRHRGRHPGRAHRHRPGRAPRSQGAETGTLFHATGRRRPTRLLWLAHATEPQGRLVLDAGAVRALTERRASLLPAGITGVDGRFVAGDPVDLVDEAGSAVARGLVNYDAAELPGCWAARPATWPRSWARRTSARSSTATTSSYC